MLIWAVAVAAAPAAPPEYLHPVDQAVADLDPLATSLRRLEWGLRVDGEQSSLIRRQVDNGGAGPETVHYRVGQGFIARAPRLNYLVRRGKRELFLNITPRRDGEFIEMPAADTVYDLRLPDQIFAPNTAAPPSPAGVDPRLFSSRIDTRIDTWLHDPHAPVDPANGPIRGLDIDAKLPPIGDRSKPVPNWSVTNAGTNRPAAADQRERGGKSRPLTRHIDPRIDFRIDSRTRPHRIAHLGSQRVAHTHTERTTHTRRDAKASAPSDTRPRERQ